MSEIFEPREVVLLDRYLDGLPDVPAAPEDLLDPGLCDVVDALSALGEADWGALGSGPAEAHEAPARPRPHRRPSPVRHRWRAPATVAAVLVLVAVVVASLLTVTTPRRAPSVEHPSTPAWHVAGFIQPARWGVVATQSTEQLTISCPTVTDCYAATVALNGVTSSTVAASRDGGATWAPTAFPAGEIISTGPVCPTAEDCVAGAVGGATSLDFRTLAGHAVMDVTHDGGATWAAVTLPPQINAAVFLACSSAEECVTAAQGPNVSSEVPGPMQLFATSDGGATWAPVPLAGAAAVQPEALSCTGSTCVLLVEPRTASNLPTARVTAWWSDDSGRHWTQGAAPSEPGANWHTACEDTSTCLAVASAAPGPTTPRGDSSGPGFMDETTDGGRSWHPLAARGIAPLIPLGLDCPAAGRCWAVGVLVEPSGQMGPGILSTADGGRTWQRDPLPTRASAAQERETGFLSLSYPAVYSISCPEAQACRATAPLSSLTNSGISVVLSVP